MKTLELKHLSPYLPYELKLIFPKSGRIICLSGLQHTDSGTFIFIATDGNFYEATIWGFKPILRPLSDLTKEIEHNGHEFVPIDELLENRDCDAEYNFIEALEDDWSSADDKMRFVLYSLMQKMLEWHFDVFGLIPQGLAIDINSLEE